MPPRMKFNGKSTRKSKAARGSKADIEEAPETAVIAGPSNPEEYPFGNGELEVRHLPLQMIIEDNMSLDYLLCYSRREFSSEPVELLAKHRDMQREATRLQFAPDELHVRQLLEEMLDAHVAETATMQVTLPGGVVTGLRAWLKDFKAASSKDQRNLPLPTKDIDTAMAQCMRDVKNDMMPRFFSSPLCVELSKLHLACILSHSVTRAAFEKLPLADLEKDALNFWVAAHTWASTGNPADKGQEVYDQWGPKLPLFEVPVEECQRVETALKGTPSAGLFMKSQVLALNLLSEQYYTFMESGEAASVISALNASSRAFDRKAMPAMPTLDAEDDYLNAW